MGDEEANTTVGDGVLGESFGAVGVAVGDLVGDTVGG